jgi:hypothetical protein
VVGKHLASRTPLRHPATTLHLNSALSGPCPNYSRHRLNPRTHNPLFPYNSWRCAATIERQPTPPRIDWLSTSARRRPRTGGSHRHSPKPGSTSICTRNRDLHGQHPLLSITYLRLKPVEIDSTSNHGGRREGIALYAHGQMLDMWRAGRDIVDGRAHMR